MSEVHVYKKIKQTNKERYDSLFHALTCDDLHCRNKVCHGCKNILIHLSICDDPDSCTRKHCKSSRNVLGDHYSRCLEDSCKICKFIKRQFPLPKAVQIFDEGLRKRIKTEN